MQKLIDAKDAKIEELEAALGYPLSLWWKATGQEKEESASVKPPPPEPPTGTPAPPLPSSLGVLKFSQSPLRLAARAPRRAGRRGRRARFAPFAGVSQRPMWPDSRRQARVARSAPSPRSVFTASRSSSSRGARVVVERLRVSPPQPERDIMTLSRKRRATGMVLLHTLRLFEAP